MTLEELAIILEAHHRWLHNDPYGRRADLQRANLREADLREADLDFSVLPLWCGLLDLKCDQRLFAQVAYHLCRMDVPDDLIQYQDTLRDIARKFHRFDECGGLPDREEDKS